MNGPSTSPHESSTMRVSDKPGKADGEQKMDEAFQPIYIDVAWTHDFEAEPIRLVSQLDNQRYEVRKLEFFRDGRVGYADGLKSAMGTQLGELPVPPLIEINSDAQFDARIIESTLFNQLWSKHAFGPEA
ncbi:hypothetical protein bAD24_p01405 (plasmid) [Burkholderia sp. AD24]|nr:hypothetical protein bAD24_p00110 [Burkholderia sp. AD24]ASL48978.1 hypothetical protein bAD24_p01405 [Burkholderia sp. AD24]